MRRLLVIPLTVPLLAGAVDGPVHVPLDTAARAAIWVAPGETAPAVRGATLECGARHRGTGFLAEPRAAARACETLLQPENIDFVEQGPPWDRQCTQRPDGPDVAVLAVVLRGELFTHTFGRGDGCMIEDWGRFRAVIGDHPTGQEPQAPAIGPRGLATLLIRMLPREGAAPVHVATVTCEDVALGTGHLAAPEAAARACEMILRPQIAELLDQGFQTCPKADRGPPIVGVTGWIRSVGRVGSAFNWRNECQVAVWKRLEPILGPPPRPRD